MSDNWSYLQSSTPDRCGMHWDGKECGKPGTLVLGYVLCPTCSERMDEPSDDYLTAMVDGYIKAALWASIDTRDGEAGPRPLDDDFDESDLASTARDSIESDCRDFATGNWADLKDMDPTQAGHDFLLTRDHHGDRFIVGFWDRGLGDKGDRLTAAAHVWGKSGLYVGDSGDIHTTNENTATNGALTWESAGTDEPGDQNADTSLVEHGYWSLGPAYQAPGVDGERWSVELVEQNEDLEQIGGVSLGTFATEADAKAAAQTHEARRCTDCGCEALA